MKATILCLSLCLPSPTTSTLKTTSSSAGDLPGTSLGPAATPHASDSPLPATSSATPIEPGASSPPYAASAEHSTPHFETLSTIAEQLYMLNNYAKKWAYNSGTGVVTFLPTLLEHGKELSEAEPQIMTASIMGLMPLCTIIPAKWGVIIVLVHFFACLAITPRKDIPVARTAIQSALLYVGFLFRMGHFSTVLNSLNIFLASLADTDITQVNWVKNSVQGTYLLFMVGAILIGVYPKILLLKRILFASFYAYWGILLLKLIFCATKTTESSKLEIFTAHK